jgi:hypothetical protein
MEPDNPAKIKIAVLLSEMDAIHIANSQYWKHGDAVTLEARAEHQQRRNRLDEIRADLENLQKR